MTTTHIIDAGETCRTCRGKGWLEEPVPAFGQAAGAIRCFACGGSGARTVILREPRA
ncbi:hypothetical protein [Cereibacter sphaeroides]|jgi:DnaJ-class molecular chaperone|uniref:hypothetical protein n=1 Tax=Cereibacter sphaeroides TaxID=1063 RepID=UPI00030F2D8B